MEFLGLLSILLLIGAIFGWISFFKVRSLEAQLTQLKQELHLIRLSLTGKHKTSDETATKALETPRPPITTSDTVSEPTEDIVAPVAETKEPEATAEQPDEKAKNAADWDYDKPDLKPEKSEKKPRSPVISRQYIDPNDMFSKFKDNWMLWIGGVSVALAGVFLARYAIQHGVLGPVGRIVAGVLTGLALHGAAEYLRRRLQQNHATFAMLAAGGTITLFATMLASLHYYQMFSPAVVFVVLAIVAVATMWLSLIYGPIIAAMGMIGAYVLPILVSTGSGNIVVALAYSLIITGSILMLMQYVSRSWLWYGMLAGSLFWWAASLDNSRGDIWREWYLAILAYGFISVMSRDWFLSKVLPFASGDRFYGIYSKQLSQTDRWLTIGLLLIVIAQQFSVLATKSYNLYFPAWIPLGIIVMLAARKNAYLSLHAWLAMIGPMATLLYLQFDKDAVSIIQPILENYQSDFLTNMVFVTLIFGGMAYFNSREGLVKPSWTAMTLVTPLLVLMTTYLCVPMLLTEGFWTMSGVLLGALYIFLATTAKSRQWHKAWEVWLYLSGHFAYTFAATTFFENGTLTLAIAIQAITLAFVIKRYELPQLGWLLKLITTVTVLRLSVNPWLLDYSTTEHWTIWTYGGSFVAVMLASYILSEMARLRRWLEGAGMHLLVLTIWIECRYYLYDGAVFQSQYTFTEASLTILIFGALALVYYYRSSLSEHSQKIYRYYSYVLMLLALGNYAIILAQTLNNDYSVWSNISATPIWNIMLLAYGFPVLLSILAMRFYNPKFKKYFEYLAGLTAFVFVNLEIRHLWQGDLNLNTSTSDAEFYTYSVFWLVAAIAMVLAGSYRLGRRYYKVGMTMLALVVVKVFLFDMSQLDGIYRILAFMGLGLCLLAMSYVHKKLILVLEEREQ